MLARKEWKESKQAKFDGEGFEVVAGQENNEEWENNKKLEGMNEAQRKKVLHPRALIKAQLSDKNAGHVRRSHW